jgi:hypothetical protein
MKKILIVSILALALLSGCAAPKPQPLDMEYWPLTQIITFVPENLISQDREIRAKAIADYNLLTDDSKQKVATYLAYTLADENDPAIRHLTYDMIRYLKPGGWIVTPLVKAYGAGSSEAAREEIGRFIKEFNPSGFDLNGLRELLKEKGWAIRLTAMKQLSLMKTKAWPAMPEILQVMRETGPSYGIYEDCYDYAAVINLDAALAAVALDIKEKSPYIRESALRTLDEVYRENAGNPGAVKTALNAMIRAMYGDDAELSKTARDMLESSGSKDALLAVHDFDGMPKMKVISMKQLTIKKLKERFDSEEDDLRLTLRFFYEKAGRQDAAGALKQ